MLKVSLHPLLHVRQVEDLIDAQPQAGVDQVEHELIIADAIIFEPAKPGPGIHHEGEQVPAGGAEDFIAAELGGIRLIDRVHHFFHTRELPGTAEVVIDDSGRTRSDPAFALERDLADDPLDFGGMMIEPEAAARNKWDVGQYVIGRHGKDSILEILGVDELDGIDLADMLEQYRTNQTVEIGSCDQTHCELLGIAY